MTAFTHSANIYIYILKHNIYNINSSVHRSIGFGYYGLRSEKIRQARKHRNLPYCDNYWLHHIELQRALSMTSKELFSINYAHTQHKKAILDLK